MNKRQMVFIWPENHVLFQQCFTTKHLTNTRKHSSTIPKLLQSKLLQSEVSHQAEILKCSFRVNGLYTLLCLDIAAIADTALYSPALISAKEVLDD
ncbi:MAG: hypothetical protein WBA57_07415 [Elainellaceae cyanobacterium]